MKLTQDLQSYQDKRRFPNWQPKKPETQRITNGNDAIVQRCLHFLPLELQVGDWCTTQQELPPGVQEFLTRNAEDESKHDIVLKMLADYYCVGDISDEANRLLDQWRALDCNPVLAAYTLEMGVFFSILPTLIKHGDVYAATVAQWINDDERVHVETNLRIIRELKLKITKELAALVYNTVVYIYSPLGADAAKANGQRAVKRLLSGKDEQMLTDSLPVTIAFFEQHDKRAIVY